MSAFCENRDLGLLAAVLDSLYKSTAYCALVEAPHLINFHKTHE